MARTDDVFSLFGQCNKHRTDGRHARIEGHNVCCARYTFNAMFKIFNRWVAHARVIGGRNASAKHVGHRLCIVKLVGHGVVNGHAQGIVSIAAFVGLVYGARCFPHYYMFSCSCYTCLIPLHGIAVATALVVFKGIGKRGGITTEGEVVAGVWGQNHRTTHAETVKVGL